MAELTTVARPYAKAAFQFAVEAKQLAEWASFLELAAAVVNDSTVAEKLSDPKATAEQRAELVSKICGDEISGQEKNYITLLAKNDRLFALPEIATLYEALKAEQEKTVDVNVTSAFELTEAQQEKIAAALKSKLGRDVNISSTVDNDLIGGVVIRAGDMVIDGSVKGKLAKLAEAIN